MIENVASAIFSETTSVGLPQVTTTIYGTAVSDSSDGVVTVVMDGESVTQPSGEEETVTLTPDEFTDGRANLPSAAYSGTVVIVDSNGRQLDEDEFQVDGSVLTIEALQGGVPVVVDYLASITSTVSSDQFPDGTLELPYTPVGDISVTVDGEAVEYTADGAVLTIPSAVIATDAVFEITYVREVSVSPVFDERQYILADSPESITLAGLTLSESEEAVETAIIDYTLDGALLTIGETVSYDAYRLTYQMTEVMSLNWTDTVEEEDDSEDVEEDEETDESTEEEETESQAGIVELPYHPISLSITKDGEEYTDYTLDDLVVTLAWTPDTPVSYTIVYQALYSVSYVSSEFTVGSVTLPHLPAGTIDDDVLTPTQMSVTVDDSPVEYTLQGVELSIPSLVLAVTSYSVSYQAENTTGEVEIPTSPAVREGESVQISVINGTPVVTSVLGWGDAEDARISSIEVDYVKASTLEADVAVLGYAKVTELEATNARVGTLEATTADIDTIRANSAKVNDITANQLTAATGYIETLTANSVTAQNLVSDHGEFADVKANAAKVTNLTAAQLEADHATVTNLNANYAQINLANVNNAWIQNGVVKDGSITNAMINDVSANKLTAGTIDASNITVTNLNASNITTGTINGHRLGEGSISLSKLEDDVYTESEINTIVDGLNDRIDGAIETFTGTDVPTLNNTPASSWTTDDLKDSHVGDVYYVVNSSSQQNGYCYRFTKSGSSYSWQLIKDSDVTAALSRLTTAEGHITQFDTDISTLKTDTGSLKTRTTTLETQMSDAQTQISTKVDTSTFNDLSSTVDSNSATITSLSTVVTNNGLTSETNITNTVNSVSQTATSNASKITGLETITTNNGLTSSTNITNKVSSIEQDLDEFKSTVSSTYATQAEVKPTAVASGTIVTAADALAATPRGLTVYGSSTQDGTPTPEAPVAIQSVTGNLYRETLHAIGQTWTSTVSVTKADYNRYIVNGTSTGTHWLWGGGNSSDSRLFVTLPAGTYTAVLGGADASKFGIATRGKINGSVTALSTSGNPNTFTIDSEIPVEVAIYTLANKTFSNSEVSIQLYEGSSADGTFVPYGSIGLKAVGRNLLPAPESWQYSVSFSVSDGVVTKAAQSAAAWQSFRLYSLPATPMYGRELTVSFEHRSDDFVPTSSYPALTVDFEGSASNNGTRTRYRRLGTASESPVPTTEWEKWSYTFTCSGAEWFNAGSGEVNFVGIGIWVNTTSSFQIRNVQLELGSTATEYEPYSGTTTPIDLQGHQLRSLPDGTRDELSVDSAGNVTLTQRVGSYTVTGSETIKSGTDLSGWRRGYVHVLQDAPSKKDAEHLGNGRGLCTHAPYLANYGIRTNHTYANISDVFMFAQVSTDADLLAAYTGATILYPLATPQTISLGTVDLPTLPSPEFTAWTVDTTNFNLDYWRTSGLDALITRIATAETSIDQNANNISLKAERSDIYTTVIDEDDQEVEVKAWDAAIDVTADAIRSEVKDISNAVDKKTDSEDHDELVTRVSNIEQRANSIEATVEQHVTKDDVETYVKAQLGLTTQDFTVTFEEDIANAKTEVLNTVENTYVTSEAADDAYASKSGTQESIAAALSAIAEVTAAVNDETAARKQWLDFNRDAGLLIGSVDSNVFLELSNDRISFMDTEGVESAYASNGEFHAPTLVADDRLELGNWALIPRDNGNLTFKWIGEDE